MTAICEGSLARGWKSRHLSFPNGIRTATSSIASPLTRCSGAPAAGGSTSRRRAPRIGFEGLIKKHNATSKLERAIEDAARLGFLTQGNFMIGFPTETYEEMQATVEWSLRSPLHLANYFRVIPLAGTPMVSAISPRARALAADPTQHDINHTEINMTEVPSDRIEALRRHAYRAFHGDPRRVARLARVMPKHPTLFPLYLEDALARLGGGATSGDLFGRLGRALRRRVAR